MTRGQFIDSVCDFSELSVFCEECYCTNGVFEYIYADGIDERICEDIRDSTNGLYWHQIRDALDGIEELEWDQWYCRNDQLDYSPALCFEDEKDKVLNYVDIYGEWDEEDPDELDEDGDNETECDIVLGDLTSYARILGI